MVLLLRQIIAPSTWTEAAIWTDRLNSSITTRPACSDHNFKLKEHRWLFPRAVNGSALITVRCAIDLWYRNVTHSWHLEARNGSRSGGKTALRNVVFEDTCWGISCSRQCPTVINLGSITDNWTTNDSLLNMLCSVVYMIAAVTIIYKCVMLKRHSLLQKLITQFMWNCDTLPGQVEKLQVRNPTKFNLLMPTKT